MRIWIDNTGLQGAGRCLAAKATSENDVRGLLQLAILLVFSENVQLGSFEPPEIVDASAEYHYRLLSLGVDGAALSIQATTRSEYENACTTAAEFAGIEICNRLRRNEHQTWGGSAPDLPRGAVFDPDLVPRLVGRVNGTQDYEHIARDAMSGDRKAHGAVSYMIASSALLRSSITRLVTDWHDWSQFDSWQIESFLRLSLNEALGEASGALYAPAISRAQQIGRQQQLLFEGMINQVQTITKDLNADVHAPSIFTPLIDGSKGEPAAVIQEALRLRALASPFRKYMSGLLKKYSGVPSEAEIDRELRDIGDQLRVAIRSADEERLRALNLTVPIGLPPGTLEKAELEKWKRERALIRKRFIVLTEMAHGMAHPDKRHDYYRILVHKSSGGTL